MKVNCPNCQKLLQAPDQWAGRKVRCPGCKQTITLHRAGAGSDEDDLGLDLATLGSIESAGEAVVSERKGKPMTLREAQAAAAAGGHVESLQTDPTIRACPHCGEKVRSQDLYSDLMCRHCGSSIPGMAADTGQRAKYVDPTRGRTRAEVRFYTGFHGAVIYPLPAMSSILVGMVIALAIIAVPLSGLLLFTSLSTLNPQAAAEAGSGQASLAWVGIFLTVMFVLEGIYFGSVGYYALIDTIRTTVSGNEHPPPLTWNITKLGAALSGYAALIGFYLLIILIMLLLSGSGFPPGREDLAVLAAPVNLLILALLTFGIPMNVVGLSGSHALDGLNLVRVGRSIGRVIGHYVFLFLIVLIYLGIYIGVMYAVMNWAGPAIMQAVREGIKVGYLNVLGGVGAWSVVMGAGFYFAYSIGRILGLFARSYKESFDFEL